MIVVNNLINQAFQKCSLVGDGMAATGNQALAALSDLKSVIAELNEQNLILSDVEVADLFAMGKIKIMGELPENWSVVDELTNGTVAGQICKCGDKVYAWENGDLTYLHWVERDDIKWPDLIINPLPDRLVTLARKIGTKYSQLLPGERQLLDSRTKMGLPTFYTCETELETVKAANKVYSYEVFKVETDSVQNVNYRLTYLKQIPDYKLNDKLYFSEKILSVLEEGLCAKLCLRYKLLDIKPLFDEEFANGVRLLKRVNNSNRPMVYDDFGGSYLDRYYDGYAPRSW